MGVSGSGKTTIGKLLADRIGGSFLDADDLHPAANINKMSHGQPLNDADRRPWLDAVANAVREHTGLCPLVLACSALKRSYRDRLHLEQGLVVFLTGPRDIIEPRLLARHKHFMPSQLLDSQLDQLEEPDEAIIISITATPAIIINQIVNILGYE